MAKVRIQQAAARRLDEVYRHTKRHWGDAHAESYITSLFAAFEKVEASGVASKPVPAAFGVRGYYFRHKRHFVYWRTLSTGEIGIVTILLEPMHQIERFREDY